MEKYPKQSKRLFGWRNEPLHTFQFTDDHFVHLTAAGRMRCHRR